MKRAADLTVKQWLHGMVVVLVTLMVLALLAGAVPTIQASRQVHRLTTLFAPAADVNSSLLQTLTDAETGLRAYDASSEVFTLEAFDAAQRRSKVELRMLRETLAPAAAQWAERLEAQDDAVAAWWEYAQQARAQLEAGGDLDLRTGKLLFDRVRETNKRVGQDLDAQRTAMRESARDELRTALLLIVAGTVLASGLALFVGWRIARSLSTSIVDLRAVVHRQRLGDRDARADEHQGPLDVRGLATDVNHLNETTQALEADQREAIRMREAVLELAIQLRGRVAVDEALAITARSMAEATGTTAAIFTRAPSADGGESFWQLAACWPQGALDESRVILQPPVSRESIAQGFWLSGRLFESEDLARDELRHRPFVKSICEQLTVGALLGTPLGAGDRVIGAILLVSPVPRRWTPHERTALQQATAHTARAVLAGEQRTLQLEHVARLESLDRQKDEFVGTVSHELRTPLTSIAGYLEMLADGDLGELSPAQLKALTVIDRNTVRLRGLIEDVLVLNRIESRGLDPSFVSVDLRGLVRDVVQDLQPQASVNYIHLDVLEVPETCVVEGDALQLGRALTNVVGNAVKFSRTGGTVTVSAVVEATRVRVQCRDEGIGIPAADMERMFSRFFRASNATAQAIPGTGLGLAIVKAIVEAHHGELELHSVEGEGTSVVLVLPLSARETS